MVHEHETGALPEELEQSRNRASRRDLRSKGLQMSAAGSARNRTALRPKRRVPAISVLQYDECPSREICNRPGAGELLTHHQSVGSSKATWAPPERSTGQRIRRSACVRWEPGTLEPNWLSVFRDRDRPHGLRRARCKIIRARNIRGYAIRQMKKRPGLGRRRNHEGVRQIQTVGAGTKRYEHFWHSDVDTLQ